MEHLDAVVRRVAAAAPEWAKTTIRDRIAMLEQCLELSYAAAQEWAEASTRARGVEITPNNMDLVGEEILANSVTIARILRGTIDVLKPAAKAESAGREPRVAAPPAVRDVGGQLAVKVLPDSFKEKQMWNGYQGELYLMPGAELKQASLYAMSPEERAAKSGTSLVLGAGNVNSITFCDAVHQLMIDNRTVVVKMNPVNDYSKPYLERVFAPFVERNFAAFVNGGAQEGRYLCEHELINHVHITGSAVTHDAIVWGVGEEAQRNRAANTPRLTKEITSELGGVGPVIVVPGEWSEKDLEYQARSVAGMVTNNVSFNCVAAKLLLLDKDWPLADAFLTKLRAVFNRTPSRPGYYPGCSDRYAKFVDQYPQAEKLSAGPREHTSNPEQHLPWLLIPDVPLREGEYALQNEAFAPVLAQAFLSCGGDPTRFLEEATRVSNTLIAGTLAASIIIDPRAERRVGDALDRAIRDLEYGTVTVNGFAGVQFALGQTAWGAYPGHSLQSIGSGIGFVHNTYMVEDVQKSVLRCPFKMLLSLPCPWFPDHSNTYNFARALLKYATYPGMLSLMSALFAAMRG